MPIDTGPTRGLILAVRRLMERNRKMGLTARPMGRALLGSVFDLPPKEWGTCRWCLRPTAGSRICWHTSCYHAYCMAAGQKVGLGGRVRGKCAMCGRSRKDGGQFEWDHRLALGVARRLPWRKAWLRAWSLDNLQLLCRACHVKKTGSDLRHMAALDAEPPDQKQFDMVYGTFVKSGRR